MISIGLIAPLAFLSYRAAYYAPDGKKKAVAPRD